MNEMEEEQDLLETFRKLNPEIRHIMLVHARSSLASDTRYVPGDYIPRQDDAGNRVFGSGY